MSPIRFGTDGWRAVVGREFTFENLAVVVQAVANLLKNRLLPGQPPNRSEILIAYDARALAADFAREAAAVLAGNGISCAMTQRPTPTPAMAHAIVEREALGGFALTASHNPPEYLGVKFVPWYAAPALQDITEPIEAEVEKVYVDRSIRRAQPQPAVLDPRRAYLGSLRRLVDLDAVRDAGLRICVDPMHGTTGGYLDTVLIGAGVDVRAIRVNPDPTFGGGLPDPQQPERLTTLTEAVQRDHLDLGLATDCDGDRFGIVDLGGQFIGACEFISLVTDHTLRRHHGETRPRIVRTMSTTHLVDSVCERHGAELIETPIGFKYVGAELRKGALLGGEESGGLSRSDHLPEKDGVFACLLAAEMVAERGLPLAAQLDELRAEHGPFLWFRRNLHFDPERLQSVLEQFGAWAAADTVAGRRVVRTDTRDGTKVVLEDGSWLHARPSGTEPIVRVYGEGRSRDAYAELERVISAAIEG